jgi:protein phosphatase
LTEDQTYAHFKRSPPPGGQANDPACMAGVGAVGDPPVLRARLAEGESLLLCSDGLHKFVPDADLAAAVAAGLQQNAALRQICLRLVETAQRNGSHDDISALLIRRTPWLGASLSYWLALLAALGLALSLSWLA